MLIAEPAADRDAFSRRLPLLPPHRLVASAVVALAWIITAAYIKVAIPGVSWVVTLLVAACTTLTDSVLSNAIVKGAFANQFVPARLRNIISPESGANDGLGCMFLFFSLHSIIASLKGEAFKTLLLKDILFTVLGAVVLGIFIGLAANCALRYSCSHNYIDKESFLFFDPKLDLMSVGLGEAVGIDDTLVSFIAGNTFTYDDWYRRETEEEGVQDVLDFLLDFVFFSFVGAAVPFGMFNMLELGITPLRLLGLAVAVLLFGSLPSLLLLYRFVPAISHSSEATSVGYFGPIGAEAILYCPSSCMS